MKKFKNHLSRGLAVFLALTTACTTISASALADEEEASSTVQTVIAESVSMEDITDETEPSGESIESESEKIEDESAEENTSAEQALPTDVYNQNDADISVEDVQHIVNGQETTAEEFNKVEETEPAEQISEGRTEETVQESQTSSEDEKSEEETSTPAEEKEEVDIYATETVGYDILRMLDFSSNRLLVGTADENIFVDKDTIISSLGDVFLLQFNDMATTRKAYMYYYDKADFVEVDTGISIAEGEAAENVITGNVMTEGNNPFGTLAGMSDVGRFDIALIDTGADGADAAVSMIGDFTGDDNGHGSAMLEYIAEQAPKARILSIKALGTDGKGDVSAVYAAIEYAISQNVKIINLSMSALAFKDSTVIEDAINKAAAMGIIVVGAAGNNGRDAGYYIPGKVANAVIVGAASKNGTKLAKSNFGVTVDYNVVAESTSEAAARLSGFIAANGIEAINNELNKDFVFATDFEPEGDVNAESEYIGAYGNRALIGEGPLYAIGIVRSTITLADRSVNTIDELWADNDGDGLFDNITAFSSTDTEYVVMYGTATPDYFAAKVADPNIYPSADFAEMLAAHDNDNGEIVDGVIYDPTTGIAYIPAGLIDFSGEQYRFNQIRIQTLYHSDMATDDGTFTAAANNTPYQYNQIDTGYGTYEVDKVPTVGSYVIITDADLEYAGGPYGGFYYDSDNRTYVATPGWVPSNSSATGLAENILSSIISNISNLTFYHASNNGYYDSTSWEITLKTGTYTLSDGTKITIKGGTYDLTCNHIGINTNFQIDSTYSGAPYGNYNYDAYYAGVYFKILYRDNDYLYIGLVTSSASTQAGAGIIKVGYKTITPGDITFTIEREVLPGNVTVSKVLKSGSTLDPNREYSFSYWASNSNSSWGTAATFKLKAGQSKSFSVPAGYYWKVEEADYSIEDIETRVTTNGGTSWTAGRTITGQMNNNTTNSYPVWFATSSPNKVVTAHRSEGGDYTLTHNQTTYLPAGSYTINEGVSVDRRYRLMPGDVSGWTHKCVTNVDIWEGKETILATTEAGKSAFIGTMRYSYQPANQGTNGEFRFENNKETGGLSVTKSVNEGTSSLTVSKTVEQCYNNDQEFTFRVTITKSNGNAETAYNGQKDGGVVFSNGVATFKLKNGAKITFTGIPAGDKYKVEEINIPSGYSLSSITNSEGRLGDVDQYSGNFDFKVTLYTDSNRANVASNVSGTYGGMAFSQGVATFTLRTGTVSASGLPSGLYYKVEETNAHGYTATIDNATGAISANKTASVTASNKVEGTGRTVTVTNKASLDPLMIIIQKVNPDGKTVSVGNGELANARFEFKFYEGSIFTNIDSAPSGNPDKTWYFITDENGRIDLTSATGLLKSFNGGSDLYETDNSTDLFGMPEGTLVIQEVTAPKGYLVNGMHIISTLHYDSTGNRQQNYYNGDITHDNEISDTVVDQQIIIPETPKTGSVLVRKYDKETGKPIKNGYETAGIKFAVVNRSTGAVKLPDGTVIDPGMVVCILTIGKDGTDESGKILQYGDYEVFELREDATIKVGDVYDSSDKLGVSEYANGWYLFDAENHDTFSITNDGDVATPGKEFSINNNEFTGFVNDHLNPSISTKATDLNTGSQVGAKTPEARIQDEVKFSGFLRNTEYLFHATIRDVEDTSIIYAEVEKLINTTEEGISGQILMPEFNFDASDLDGHTLVIFEEVSRQIDDVWTVVATHNSPLDTKQSIYYPGVGTTATDPKTGDTHIGTTTEDSVINDLVMCDNLIVGNTYTVCGNVVYKEDCVTMGGEVHMAGDLVPYKEGSVDEVVFTATAKHEEVLLSYIVDGKMLQGTTVTVFEDLYADDVLVASHADIEDEGQSIHYPKIGTTLTHDNLHDALSIEKTVLIDEIVYENLIPGETYVISGNLVIYDKDEVIPEEPEDEVADENSDVSDDEQAEDGDIVDYNEAIDGGIIDDKSDNTDPVDGTDDVADEANENEEPEEIETAIVSGRPAITDADGNILYGTLIDEDGNEVDLNAFVPEESNGKLYMRFEFDATQMEGLTVVAFETLYLVTDVSETEGGTIVLETEYIAEHKEITDEGQSVHFPKIGTTLTDPIDDGHDALDSDVITLRDTIAFKNLIPGKTYIVQGVLIDKDTGEPLVAERIVPVSEENGKENPDAGEIAEGDGENVNAEGLNEKSDEPLSEGDHILYDDELGDEIKDALADDKADDEIADEMKESDEDAEITEGDEDAEMPEETDEIEEVSIYDNESNIIVLKEFVTEESEGTVDVVFEFSGDMKNKTIVAFEQISHEDQIVAIHEDIEDEGQTVHIPEIHTSLNDSIDGEKDALAAENITLIDTVEYSNLFVGKEYVVSGILMDKETGEPILDDKGEEIISSTTFTAEKENGSVDVTFNFSGVQLKGKTIVAFETLHHNEKLIAVHADIDDLDQTVDIPEIGTSLGDIDGADDVFASEDITLIDTVSYRNLIVGNTYSVYGVLMDKETGEPILDDKGVEIVGTAEFTAEQTEGTIDITFQFNGVSLKGKTVVAFESLSHNGKLVAVHADIDDETQTVFIPQIGTLAKDEDGDHFVSNAKDIVIVDTVEYHNLIAGNEYTLNGVMMDAETGEPLLTKDGKQVTGTTTFTPEETDGTVDVSFAIPAEAISDKTGVVFEELINAADVKIAEHKDIADAKQTIYFPEIGTILMIKDGEKSAVANGTITLVDTVKYKNLEPGKEHVAKGTLMDASTGKAVMVNGKEVTGETTFTPSSPDGEILVEFTFDSTGLSGDFVAFEKMFRVKADEGEKFITVHEDLKDKDQTITLTPPSKKTGDTSNMMLYIILCVMALAVIGTGVGILIKRKRSER